MERNKFFLTGDSPKWVKSKRRREKRRRERPNDGNNNGQLRIATLPRVAHAKPPGPTKTPRVAHAKPPGQNKFIIAKKSSESIQIMT